MTGRHAPALTVLVAFAVLSQVFSAPAQAFVLAGRALDGATSQPIANATVSAPGTPAVTQSDSTGTFRLDIPESTSRVKIEARGYFRSEPDVVLQSDTAARTFRLYSDTANLLMDGPPVNYMQLNGDIGLAWERINQRKIAYLNAVLRVGRFDFSPPQWDRLWWRMHDQSWHDVGIPTDGWERALGQVPGIVIR